MTIEAAIERALKALDENFGLICGDDDDEDDARRILRELVGEVVEACATRAENTAVAFDFDDSGNRLDCGRETLTDAATEIRALLPAAGEGGGE